ncbi:MAG: hypothetical protein PVSMB1_05250 [Gemmatimonadaceae bacterium]
MLHAHTSEALMASAHLAVKIPATPGARGVVRVKSVTSAKADGKPKGRALPRQR